MTIEEWLGKDNQLGIDIWHNKYQYNNETFDEWLDRVSGGDKEVRKLIKDKKFLFGGRILANRGTGKKATMMNCYSSGYVGDSMDDLFAVNTKIAKTFKAQGGQGLSLSKIRPKWTGINNGQFQSDGIIPFMEVFNQTTSSVSQGGSRKGALLMSLDAWHKEAPDFITIKSDEGKIQKANLSLEIDDEFMKDVKAYYDTGEIITRHIVREYEGNKVEYDVTPIKVYKLMMKTAYDWGEPGCIFTNRFRHYNMAEFIDGYNIETCNPCVSGDTLVLTDNGYKRIDSLVGKSTNVWNGFEWSNVIPMVTGHNQKMLHIETSDGCYVDCTEYHKFILSDGNRIEAKDLKVGDKLQRCTYPVIYSGNDVDEKVAYTHGFYTGDGWTESDRGRTFIRLYNGKRDLLKYLNYKSAYDIPSNPNSMMIELDNTDTYNKDFVPDTSYSVKARLDWLAGYIDSDGTKQSEEGGISISSIDKNRLLQVKYLLNTLGCDGSISLMHDEGNRKLPKNDGSGEYKEYYCKKSYRISISASHVVVLMKLGLKLHRVKVNPITISRTASRYKKIKSIEHIDNAETVYCFTEELNHSGIFNGILTSQCGEQPLAKDSACDLGSLNLSEFVKKPFTNEAEFDYEAFGKAIPCAVRGLDSIIDENKNNHAVESQKIMSINYRNIGLGVMGLYDAMAKMNMTYGNDDSILFADNVFKFLFKHAFIASSQLAKEKGTFPKYTSAMLNAPIIKDNFTDDELDKYGVKEYGLRNISLISVAPAGSIATMLNVSTGCEPLFSIGYTRKTESLNHGEVKYYTVFSGVVDEYLKSHPDIDRSIDNQELKNKFITAGEIQWKKRIDMQAALQNHTDTAISSTVNLRNDITIQEIEKLYLYAWEKGLKGITIFRDGCKRAGILTTDDSAKDKDKDDDEYTIDTLPRGTIIKADDNCVGKKRTIRGGCGILHIEAFFDPDTGDLLETYFSKGSTGGCVDADTEYFNGTEWKRIADYKQGSHEKVLQYHEDGTADLVEPINYIVNDNVDTLKQFKNFYGLDMVLSEDHRMFLYKNYKKYQAGISKNLNTEIVTVKEYLDRDTNTDRHVPSTFRMNMSGIPVSDDMIRLLVSVYADGSWDNHKITYGLKKDKKKIRLRELLTKCNIGWSERNIHNTGYTDFYFYPIPSLKEWFTDKQFTSKWYQCTDHQLEIIIDECKYWDGSDQDGNRLGAYYSSKKDEIDFIQFALARLGYRASVSLNNGDNTVKPSYRLRWTRRNLYNLRGATITDYHTKDGHSYCFTVPSGLLVLRRNGKIFVTGNCNNFMIGLSRMISLAARGGVDIYSIVDQLKSCGSCPSYAVRSATKHDTSKGSCCPVAIGNALLDMYKEMQNDIGNTDETIPVVSKVKKVAVKNVTTDDHCPICGAELTHTGGCDICPDCGWSHCD